MFVSGSRNIFPSCNLAVPPSRKFNSFFVNTDSKIRLKKILFMELQSFARDQQRKFIYALKERYSVNHVKIKQDLFCDKHESDTRMFFQASILNRTSDISSIAVDADDTGVAVTTSYSSFRFQKEQLLYHKKKVVPCKHFFLKKFHLLSYLFLLLQELIL